MTLDQADGRVATTPAATPTTTPWTATLVAITVVVAVSDVAHFVLIREVIPPLAAGVVLTVVGIALLPGRRRFGAGLLGLTSLVLLIGSVPFALSHLAHPESGLDFAHAVIGTAGRVVAIVAAVGAWRATWHAGARRVAATAAGLLAVTVVVAGAASLLSTGDTPAGDEVQAEVADFAFPTELRVASGGTAFLDNRDLLRHTFTVPDAPLDVELPARQGVAFTVDLAPGTYDVICAVPGHEAMTSTLVVE